MNPDFCYDTARLDAVLCEGVCDVSAAEVARFRRLMGYEDAGNAEVAPPSMGSCTCHIISRGGKPKWRVAFIRFTKPCIVGIKCRFGGTIALQNKTCSISNLRFGFKFAFIPNLCGNGVFTHF